MKEKVAILMAQDLGQRLKLIRLHKDITQTQIAKQAGITKKSVSNAEKGQASLNVFIAILMAMGLTDNIKNFLPIPVASPMQLLKTKGQDRRRASKYRHLNLHDNSL